MKTYTLEKTSDPKLFRVVDLYGDWDNYFDEESGQYLRASSAVLKRGYNKGIGFYTALKNSTPEEWEKKLKNGGDRGDALHQFMRIILSGFAKGGFTKKDKVLSEDNKTPRELTNEEWISALAFERFIELHNPLIIAVEKSVKNLKEGYAGTFDFIIILRKICGDRYCDCKNFIGQLGLWDLKTGPSIYNDHGPQCSSYANSDLSKIIGDKKIEYTAIVGINNKTNRGWTTDFYDKKETEKHWKEFLAAKIIDDATFKPFNPEKEIYDIKETIDVKVEQAGIDWMKPKSETKPKKIKVKAKIKNKIKKNAKLQ